jgi:hypothetical protein
VVEAAILKSADVLDCSAFATHCPYNGEVPAAWVVLKDGVNYEKARLALNFTVSLCLLFYTRWDLSFKITRARVFLSDHNFEHILDFNFGVRLSRKTR